MKNRFLGWGVLLLCLLLGCQTPMTTATNSDQLLIEHQQIRYQLDSEADLSALITVLSDDQGIWVENVQYKQAQTEKGETFPAITAHYLYEDKKTNLLIPLKRIAERELETYQVNCLMACATYLSCEEQNFTVLAPCGEVKCGCKYGDGGGSGAVVFY